MTDEQLPSNLESEQRKEYIRKQILEWNTFPEFTNEWYDTKAKIQNEIGIEAIPEVIQLSRSGEVLPYQALVFIKGIPDVPGEEIYFAAKEIISLDTATDNERSINCALQMMCAFRNEQNRQEISDIAQSILSETRDASIHDSVNSIITDDDMQQFYLDLIRHEQEWSRNVYQLGSEAVIGSNWADAPLNEPHHDVFESQPVPPQNIPTPPGNFDNRNFLHNPTLNTYTYMAWDRIQNEGHSDSKRYMLTRHERRKLSEVETAPSKYLASIGCEIEVPAHGMKPNTTSADYSRLSNQFGIPISSGAKHEFSFAPSNNYELQVRQVDELFRLGLLNPEHHKYPLHINLGGIHKDSESNEYYLMWGLMASGWGSTEKRIMMDGPYLKGTAGLAERMDYNSGYSSGLKPLSGSDPQNAEYGIEMRPFTLKGFEDFARLMHTTEALAASLKAYQKPENERDEIETKLATSWQEYRNSLQEVFKKQGLRETMINFLNNHPLAFKMGEAEKGLVPDNKNILLQTRKVLIEARSKINKILPRSQSDISEEQLAA